MAAVEASPAELSLGPGAVIAAVNGPRSVVVSGDRAAVRRICEEWSARGRRTHVLRLDVAPHSPHFDALLDDYRRALEPLGLRAPRLPLLSDTTGEPVGAEAATPDFWVRAVRAPVLFTDAVGRLHRDGVTVCVEIGPADVLACMLDGCLPDGAERPLVLAVARNWQAARAEADVA
ncbi:hypothetical protein ACM01_00455 [Streptomyces viridochromogenes]|uniref:Malonyl-CoA:ACP transacylase (MAT) domain-containing protein n=1 Tax=Streptomyces viridochromogenes TaxID=1938 RepID=A0A0J8CGP2_STRVR|nr:acyltransferase domain-containing protein [Streptomyces viridochromogenes]KMS77150.1 hypothetical protein ACM01_00455 [Streptomyces viridochromogenes]